MLETHGHQAHRQSHLGLAVEAMTDFQHNNTSYCVIGVDPSLTSLGLASPTGLHVWQSKLKGMERLQEIRHWVA